MRISAWLTGLGLLVLCSCDPPEQLARGGKCHSLSDCEPGLTCVSGRCSDDLSPVRGEVPSYQEPDAGVRLDASLDAEAGVMPDAQTFDSGPPPRADAALPDAGNPDASGPRDAGTPDTASPLPEAATPEAAAPDAADPEAGQPEASTDAASDGG
jgi:hypothetical protein